MNLREAGGGGEVGEDGGCAATAASRSRCGSACFAGGLAAVHCGFDVVGFDVVSAAFAVAACFQQACSELVAEESEIAATPAIIRSEPPITARRWSGAPCNSRRPECPEQAPELIGVDSECTADAYVFCGVLLEEITDDPDEAASISQKKTSRRFVVRARAAPRQDSSRRARTSCRARRK